MAPDRRRHREPRNLTEDERALWRRVAATTDRGAGATGPRPAPDGDACHDGPAPGDPVCAGAPGGDAGADAATRQIAEAVAPSIHRTLRPEPRLNGSTAQVALTGAEVAPVGRPQAGLDRRTATRLRKGIREPDARVDLHGYTAERAHRICMTFLGDAMARGCRVVLVITGKGRDENDPMARGRGVIRESLPGWLRASPLGRSVVGIYQAHQRHGGAGAYYIYLKRRR